MREPQPTSVIRSNHQTRNNYIIDDLRQPAPQRQVSPDLNVFQRLMHQLEIMYELMSAKNRVLLPRVLIVSSGI